MLERAEKILEFVIRIFTMILMFLLTFLVAYTVVLRFIFNSGFPAGEELVRYLFVWTAFFGVALGVKARSHMSLDMLADKLPALGPLVKVVYYGGSYVFWVVVLRYGYMFMAQAAKARATLIPITMNYIYAAVPVCAVLCLIFLTFQLIHEFTHGKGDKNT